MFRAPPWVLRPNKVPWGPRKTSTLSTSMKPMSKERDGTKAPSTKVPTAGTPAPCAPTPRIAILRKSLPGESTLELSDRLGVRPTRSSTLSTRSRSSETAEKTCTDNGASIARSSRLRAVTTIVLDESSATPLAVCARTSVLVAASASAAVVKSNPNFMTSPYSDQMCPKETNDPIEAMLI